jgi:mRNA interferase HigB
MLVTGLDRLAEFASRHPDAAGRLAAWKRVATCADWHSPVEVRRTFAHADVVKLASGRTVTIFNIGGNRYRLVAAIDYPLAVVNVLALLTHAEYDKEQWKRVL